MKFILDPPTSLWLRDFIADPDNFDWDDGNKRKNVKHGVSCEEIEAIISEDRFVFAGRIVEPAHDEWRGLILGPTAEGRSLALIFTRRGEKLRPISCRPMRLVERRLYEANYKEPS